MDTWPIFVMCVLLYGEYCYRMDRRVLAVNCTSIPEKGHVSHHRDGLKDALKETLPLQIAQQTKNVFGRRNLLDLDTPLCRNWTCSAAQPKCHCDQLCVHYRDCCADAKRLETFLEQLHQMDNVISFAPENELIIFAKHSTCVDLQINSHSYSIQVVTTCPEVGSSSEEINVSSCNDNSFQFVSYNSQNGNHIVFKNMFCAFCHNLKHDMVKSWRIERYCAYDLYTESDTSIEMSCVHHIYLPYKRNKIRSCSTKTYQTCSNYNSTVSKLCSLYLNPVLYKNYSKQIQYRNDHCAICDNLTLNNTNDNRVNCVVEHKLETSGSNGGNIPAFAHPILNFNSLLTLKDDRHDDVWVDPPSQQSCPKNKVYDMSSKKCRIVCPNGYEERNNDCHQILGDYDNYKMDVSAFNLTITVYSSQNDSHDVPFFCMHIEKLVEILKERGVVSFPVNSNVDSCRHNVILKNASALSDILEGIESNLNSHSNASAHGIHANVLITNFDDASSLRCLGNVSKVITTNAKIIDIDEKLLVEVQGFSKKFSLADNLYRIFDSDGLERAKLEIFVFCGDKNTSENELTFTLNCSKVSYRPDDFIYAENMSVYIISENKYLNNNQSFEIIGNQLIICNEGGLRRGRKLNIEFDAMSYLTIVAMSASVFSLLLLLLFHIIFKDLRNLHGKCMMSFSISLLIAHLSFVGGDLYWYQYAILCKVSAVIQHYAWLCVFAWSNIMALDIARRFNVCWSIKGKLNINNSSRFLKYSLFGWIVPFVFVCSVNVIDWSQLGNFLGYSHNRHCWITAKIGVIVAFAVPVGMMVTFGFVCFCISLHGIEYSKRVKFLKKNVKRDRNKCIIYTKIFFLIGISWIVAYIGALTNVEFFQYLNIIINGLQGFLLFVAFLINSRIRRRIVQFAKKKKVNESFSSSGTIHM